MLGLTPQAGARAVRRDHRVRRAGGVPRPQAQELLVGHERAAGVLRRDPGRRRRAARRRGARGRRRRLPAEVLRRVPPPQGRGQDDRLRHARHERGRALLRPGDAARARARSSRSTSRRRSRARTTSSTSAASRPGRGARDRSSATATGAAEISDAWFEDATGERVAALAQGGAARACALEVGFHAAVEDPWFSLHLRNEARHIVFASRQHLHMTTTGNFEAGEHGRRAREPRELVRARAATTSRRPSRRPGGADVIDLREDLRQRGRPRRAGTPAASVELPHTFEVERS